MIEQGVIIISWIGLLCGAFRVIPQTYKTIKTNNIKNLSLSYFVCHLLAGILGGIYEINQIELSKAHLGFFIMVVVTNAGQIIYMLLRYKNNLAR